MFAISVVVVVTTLVALIAPGLARDLRHTDIESALIVPACVGQLLLFWGLARAGRWLQAPDVQRSAHRAMVWFAVTAALQFPLKATSLARELSVALTIVLALALLVCAIIALTQLFTALSALAARSRSWGSAPSGSRGAGRGAGRLVSVAPHRSQATFERRGSAMKGSGSPLASVAVASSRARSSTSRKPMTSAGSAKSPSRWT